MGKSAQPMRLPPEIAAPKKEEAPRTATPKAAYGRLPQPNKAVLRIELVSYQNDAPLQSKKYSCLKNFDHITYDSMKTKPIYEYLERIANLLRTDVRRAGATRGLQPVQLEAMHYLQNCNRYSNTPAAVADYLGLTKGTVSQTLSVLENAGFIEKRPDAKDKRVVHLKVTESGEELVLRAIPPQALQTAMEMVSDIEQEIILEALRQTLRNMQKANGLRSFGVCKSCKYHRIEEANASRRCALTGEVLLDGDIDKICREHEAPDEA